MIGSGEKLQKGTSVFNYAKNTRKFGGNLFIWYSTKKPKFFSAVSRQKIYAYAI
jgi:hypothetical protein